MAQDAGYRTGYVQLFHRNRLVRSHIRREIKRIDDEKPDLVTVTLFVDRLDGTKQITKAVRLLNAVMERQLKGGRQLLIIGQDNASAWGNADLAPTLQDARIKETRLRLCNLVGPQPYADGHGFRSVVKVLSNVHLWDGPPEKSSWCRCPRGSHALYEDYLTGPANYERRRKLWQGIVYYLLKLTNSRVPLVQATRHWGARPELHWKELGRKELSGGSPPTPSKLPSNPKSAHATSHEAGGGKSRQPKRKKQEEEKNEARQSDAKVSALLGEVSVDTEQLTTLDRIVNHAHDEIDLLLLGAQSTDLKGAEGWVWGGSRDGVLG